MQSYCLVCKKATDNANSKAVKIKGRLQMRFVQYVVTKKVYSFHKVLVYLIC